MTSRTRPPTLWERGRHPGRLVVRFSAIVLTLAAAVSVLLEARLGIVFDVAFVAMCVATPLWVRPGDFFTVGILPPVLLTAAVIVLAIAEPALVAQPHDSFAQALVSGLAHHGIALAAGYCLTLLILGLRQVAHRNTGIIRPGAIRAAVVADSSAKPDRAPDVPLPTAPTVVGQRRPPAAEQLAPAAEQPARGVEQPARGVEQGRATGEAQIPQRS